jgi:hypothetical protein
MTDVYLADVLLVDVSWRRMRDVTLAAASMIGVQVSVHALRRVHGPVEGWTDGHRIEYPAGGGQLITVAHELAHVVTPRDAEAHGERWEANMGALVHVVTLASLPNSG